MWNYRLYFNFNLHYFCGYIFTNDNEDLEYESSPDNIDPDDLNPYDSGAKPKLDKSREFAKWNDEKKIFECLFYDKDDYDSFYPKYKDLGKKQYNYHKDFSFPDENSKYGSCKLEEFIGILQQGAADQNEAQSFSDLGSQYFTLCSKLQDFPNKPVPGCSNLFYDGNNDISNKYQYDKWVTSIIFGCIIIALNLGLAVFGFLMFKESDGSSGLVSLK